MLDKLIIKLCLFSRESGTQGLSLYNFHANKNHVWMCGKQFELPKMHVFFHLNSDEIQTKMLWKR